MCGASGKRTVAGRHRLSGTRGFTLLELIIVLVILAMLVALAWPALRRPVMRSVVQQAARQLVKDLSRARMAAIDSGRIMALQYELDGRRYTVTFADALGDRTESVPESADQDAASDAAADLPSDFGFEAELDEDVTFRDPSSINDEQLPPGSTLREMLEDERQETETVTPLINSQEQEAADKAFSTPVFFYPTGRAENAELLLQGPDGYRLTVKLRGLTGAASIGPLEHAPRIAGKNDQSGKEPERAAPREEFIEPDASDK